MVQKGLQAGEYFTRSLGDGWCEMEPLTEEQALNLLEEALRKTHGVPFDFTLEDVLTHQVSVSTWVDNRALVLASSEYLEVGICKLGDSILFITRNPPS